MDTEATHTPPGDRERDEGFVRACAVQRHGRLVRDHTGHLWCVYEGSRTRNRSADEPSLIFESQAAVRTVRTFPPGWRGLSDDDLIALSTRQW